MLRIRQWWYLSPRVAITLRDGERLSLAADLSHRESLPRRFLQFVFVPWRALSLVAEG